MRLYGLVRMLALSAALALAAANITRAGAAAPATGAPSTAASTPGTAPKTPADSADHGYAPSQEIRVGDAAAFRNLIPAPMLEQQAADAYRQWLSRASRQHRLLPDSAAQVKRLRAIMRKLEPAALKWNDRAKQWHWEINLVRSSDINIVGLPGGKLLVFSGLLDKIRPNDQELAMLLGHEIAHALREHARERLGRQQATQQLNAGTNPRLFGLTDVNQRSFELGPRLLSLHYGRADETEADVIGTEIASRSGYDPRAGITIWNRLAASRRARSDFLSHHPFDQSRIADLKKRLPDMLALYAKALNKSVDNLPHYRMTR